MSKILSGYNDIEDFSKYKVKKMYGNTENEKVNLNYIAIILRTADLLHITRDRTPSVAKTDSFGRRCC